MFHALYDQMLKHKIQVPGVTISRLSPNEGARLLRQLCMTYIQNEQDPDKRMMHAHIFELNDVSQLNAKCLFCLHLFD
jgi:hypothetical protein